jgi:hypothetical protein
MIGPLLRFAAMTVATRNLREAATDGATRALFAMAAFAGSIVVLLCFTRGADWRISLAEQLLV